MTQAKDPQRWARLRFAVVGPLLAAPPPPGQLQTALRKLSEQHWLHPNTGLPVSFGVSTIEAWYYKAKKAQDPVSSLSRARRQDAGRARVFTASAVAQIHALYRQNPSWSVQLHYDNLCACSDLEPSLGKLPSYSSLKRYLRANGMVKKRKPRTWRSAASRQSMCTGFSTWISITVPGACWNPMDAGSSRCCSASLMIIRVWAVICSGIERKIRNHWCTGFARH